MFVHKSIHPYDNFRRWILYSLVDAVGVDLDIRSMVSKTAPAS
jgi:hypothetical protein